MVNNFWLSLPLLLGVVVSGQGTDWVNALDNVIEDGERRAEKAFDKFAQLKEEHWKRLTEKVVHDQGERIRLKRSLWVEQLRREWEARERQRAEEEAAEARRAADEERRRWEEARAGEEEARALAEQAAALGGEERSYADGGSLEDGSSQWGEGAQWERRQASGGGGPSYSSGQISGPRQPPSWADQRRDSWEDQSSQGFTPSRVSQAYRPNEESQGPYSNRGSQDHLRNQGSQDYHGQGFQGFGANHGSENHFPNQESQGYSPNVGSGGYFSNQAQPGYQANQRSRPTNFARVPVGQRPVKVQGGVTNADVGWIQQREREEAALAAQRAQEERMEEERRRKEAEREAEEERDELEAREIERSLLD